MKGNENKVNMQKNENSWDLTQRKHYLFHLTWPIFVELFLQMLVGNVDQMMVGWVSPSGVGAIGNANQIINLLVIAFSVISMAATILTTQSMGAKDYHRVSTIYTVSLVVNALFALVVSVILYLGAPTIFTWMQVPAELMEETVAYTRIIGSGLILQGVFLTFSAIFKSNRLMMESMVVAVVMNAANILGNYLLIGGVLTGEPLGVAGAAISSNIAKAIGMVLIIWLFQKKIKPGLSFKSLRPFPTQVLRRLLYIGLPSGGETVSYSLSQAVTMGFVNLCGGVTITTRVYANMFAMISYLYANAISQSSQVLVGYAIGAQDYGQANRRVWRTTLSAVVISFSIAAFLFLFSDTIFGFFTDDPAVIALGRQILFIDMFLEIGRAINTTMVRALTAANDVIFPIAIGIGSQWCISVVLCYTFGIILGWGLPGIWIAMTCDEGLRGILFIIRWKGRKWQRKSEAIAGFRP